MTSTRIEPGTFVRHSSLGVGKVIGRDDSGGVTVDFKTSETRQMSASVARNLTVLPDNGLEAIMWNGPEKIWPWVENAPLKLLAATLADIDGTAKAGDIKGKLQALGVGETVKRNSWWERVRAAAGGSKYFKTVKNKNNAVTGIGLNFGINIDDVPAEPLPPLPPKRKPATLSDWKRWLLSQTAEPPPGRWPTKNVCSTLDKWPAETIGLALDRTIWGAGEFLTSGSTPPQVAAGWLESVSRASMRWIGCTWPDSDRHLVEQTVELLGRLSKHTEETGLSKFLAGALSGQLGTQQIRAYEVRWERVEREQERQRVSYEEQLAQQGQELNRQRVSYEEQLAQQGQELNRQRVSFEEQLEQDRQERERLRSSYDDDFKRHRQLIETYRAQMSSGREESRLEVRYDMLLAVGDVLQRACWHGRSSEERLNDVIANLPKVLRDGGAEPLGTAGETVKYDPRLHHSTKEITKGDWVHLFAPGVIVRGGSFGEQVIVKASVRHQ